MFVYIENRIPIKLNPLEFHEIVNRKSRSTYDNRSHTKLSLIFNLKHKFYSTHVVFNLWLYRARAEIEQFQSRTTNY